MTEILLLVVGAAAGAALLWLTVRVRLLRLPELQMQLAAAEARREAENKAASEKLVLLEQAKDELSNAFRALSADALKTNNEQFLQLAKESVVEPLKLSLTNVDKRIGELEVARTRAYTSLDEHLRSLTECQTLLRTETSNLVKALRTPAARGRWGELQLKRVVEMAGMIEYCDFCEQQTVHTPEGRLRPDLVVRLPSNRTVVVDSKVPLAAYLDAMETQDDAARLAHMRAHAGQVRTHLTQLAARSYWAQFDSTPDFVVAFLPGESCFSAALQHDPELIEYGIERRVLIATPTTLIALLKAVAYGWRQESVARNAQEISRLGREIYDRIGVLAENFTKVGLNLDRATEAYNRAVGSLETRVLVSARKLKDTGVDATIELPSPAPVERAARQLQSPELQGTTGAGLPA